MNSAMTETASSKSPSPFRIAVIGGGLAGLSAAHRLMELSRERQHPVSITIYEAASHWGGLVQTKHHDDYLVEYGADSFITNKPWAVSLCERLGLGAELIPTETEFRRSLVLRKGRPVPVPGGFQLMAPAKIWPIVVSPIFSPWGKLRLGLEYLLPRQTGLGDESLAEFTRRRFGREALERLVQPMIGGIYTSDPEKLSLAATLPRFQEFEHQFGSVIRGLRRQQTEAPDNSDGSSGARYGLFATLRDGLVGLTTALVNKLADQVQLEADSRVDSIESLGENGSFQFEISGGAKAEFDGVIVALPAYRAASLVEPIENKLAEALKSIEYASSAIVISGHRLQDIQHPLDAFGLVIPAIENRKILAVSFASRKFAGRAPDGRVLLRTFVGGAMQPELLDRSDEDLLDLVAEELQELLGVPRQADFALVSRYADAMPQYHVGHLEIVGRIEQCLEEMPRLALAGNAFHGVGIPDTIRSGERAAERIFQSI